jgi:hypothetical protein
MDRGVVPGRERRAAPRHATGDWSWAPAVALRTGQQATLVNWSRVGLLLESSRQLAPGTRVTLSLRGPQGDVTLHGRIVRAIVSGVTAQAGVLYHVGIQTDVPIELPVEIRAHDGNQIPEDAS